MSEGNVVWVHYTWDMGYHALQIFATAEEASKRVAGCGYGQTARWPIGMELNEAIETWERT